MKLTSIFNFFSTSILIILALSFINWKSFFIPRKQSDFTEISIIVCKVAIVFFILGLNYSLFYNEINFISVFLDICKILSLIVLLLCLCKVIILKHIIVYNSNILLRKHINKLSIENNKLIVETNNETFYIDINDKLNKKLLKIICYK